MKKINLIYTLFLFFSTYSLSQNYTISGHITDVKNGETLINSSVFENKSQKGSVSNSYGFYSLTIPKGNVNLIYSYVGFAQQNRIFNRFYCYIFYDCSTIPISSSVNPYNAYTMRSISRSVLSILVLMAWAFPTSSLK